MYFLRFIGLLAFLSAVYALADQNNGQNDQGKTLTKTTVWITKTVAGKVTTSPLVYKQSFKTTYTDAKTEKVKSGKIGIGSQTGSVGHVRTYQQTTILNSNAGADLYPNIYSGTGGAVLALIAALV